MGVINLAVYRVHISFYQTSKGFAKKSDLVKMKRLSNGFDPLEEEFSNIGGETSGILINLEEAKGGELYSIEVINVTTDWETGYPDGRDLSVVKYEPEKNDEQT